MKKGIDRNSIEEIHLDLFNNAIDFLTAAVSYYCQSTSKKSGAKKNLKYAILHLWSSIELLLKESLRRIHECLIFSFNEDIFNESFDVVKGGIKYVGINSNNNFKTIDFETSLKRLKNFRGYEIADNKAKLMALKNKRNQIEHAHIKISNSEAVALFGGGVSFILYFIREILKENPEDFFEHEDWKELIQIKDVYDDLKSHVEKLLSKINYEARKDGSTQEVGYDCPECGEKAIIIDEKYIKYSDNDTVMSTKCHICSHEVSLVICSSCKNIYLEDDFGLSYDADAETYTCENCENDHWYAVMKDD